MMSNELLNVMSEDELRNYAGHLTEALSRIGDMLYAYKEHIELLQRTLNSRDYMHDRRSLYDRELYILRSIEDELGRTHWEDISHPVSTCGCCEVKE